MKKVMIVLLLLVFVANLRSMAQESKKDTTVTGNRIFYLIKKTDNAEFYGYIITDDGREILLETKNIGRIYINKADIKEIIALKDSEIIKEGSGEYGDFREVGAYTTRYYFTTNAMPIKKGENYAMLHLFGPEVHFALTDNFSLGVMSTWIASPLGLAAKYSFNSKGKTHIAIGTIMASSSYIFNARGYGGLHWLTITHGSSKSNISFSAGYGYAYVGAKNQSIGAKYSYQSDDPNKEFYVSNYGAYYAIEQKLYGNNYSNMDFIRNSPRGAIATSIAGITPVGKKSSFIFDSMVFINRKEVVDYTDYTITVTYDDYSKIDPVRVTETYTIGEGQGVKKEGVKATIVLMPSLRFNKSHDKAFQVALAGVINISDLGEITTFPVPMVSWLRQF